MRVILNIHGRSFIQGNEQYCNTARGFVSIQEMHPEDTFIVENEESQKELDFFNICEEMNLTSEDVTAMEDYAEHSALLTLKDIEDGQIQEWKEDLYEFWINERYKCL